MQKLSWIVLLSVFAASSLIPIVHAQSPSEEDKEDIVDLKTVTCRDLLLTDGADRTNTIVFMHGYINGTKGDTTIDGSALADASEKILTSCVDTPNSTLFSVFEANR